MMPRPVASNPAGNETWKARLTLRFARMHGRSRLVERAHVGPLVVQKALYPEGPDVCQTVLVHPPGGMAGGDQLEIDIDVTANAHAQIITPGAAKWYRSLGLSASQRLRARITTGAVLEWLPHESIVFDGARADLQGRVELTADGVFIGADIVALGRRASGERFSSGSLRQRFELVRDDALLWTERAALHGGSRMLRSPLGLAERPVFGTLWIAAPTIDADFVRRCRNVGSDLASGDSGITAVPGVLMARARADVVEPVRAWLTRVWQLARPVVLAREAMVPRLWST